MECSIKSLASGLFALMSALALQAGTTNFNFNVDPSTLLNADSTPTILFAGNHTSGFWSANNGQGGASDGFVSLVDNTGSQTLLAAFPYLDGSNAPIAAFTFDMDLRVGNPTNANSRPADGFSVCFARNSDLVLSNAWPVGYGGPGILNGFAGGGSMANARFFTPGTASPENGTKSGIAIAFDAYEGGWLPDSTFVNGAGSNDREGIELRVDDTTLIQFPLPDRNGNCSNTTCQASAASDINSIQTGPFMGTTNKTGYANLTWQHLKIVVTNNLISVTWKGRTAISTNYPYWSPTPGRIVVAARTGGNCEYVQIDNVAYTTYPSTNSFLQNVVGNEVGCNFTLCDYSNQVASITQVLLDNSDVTSFITQNRTAPYTYGTLTLATNLGSYSKHALAVVWQTDTGISVGATNLFIVPVYSNISTNGYVPLTSIDTTKPGFLVNSVQTRQNNPNGIAWTEQEVIGLRGANVIGASSAGLPQENGMFVWDGALDFFNPLGTASGGYFGNNYDMAYFGISTGNAPQPPYGPYDYCAMEFFGYIYFPTSGVYNFVFGSDDSYQFSMSQNPYDRMGLVVSSMQGSRLLTGQNPPIGSDIAQVSIPQPGCYPFRLLYQNGGGNAAIEWYSYYPNAPVGSQYILVNDTNTPGALLTYRPTAAPSASPYVKSAVPVRNDPYAVFFQPVVVDLANGTGNGAVDPASVSLAIDGTGQSYTLTQAAGVSHVVQTLTNYWSTSAHTAQVSFNDLNGTNYTYSWQFTVMGGVVAPTNAVGPLGNIINLPAAARVDPSTLSQPGFRVHSHQMYFKQANSIGTAEEELEGLRGPNLADQSGNTGPGYFAWNDMIDLRKASGTGTGAAGEYSLDTTFSTFGIKTLQMTSGQNNVDNSAVEIGAWLVFPAAGNYIMHVNSDDGMLLALAQPGNPFSKVGLTLALRDASGGMTGESATGLVTGNSTYAVFNVPTAGAYPFRLLYENANGDAGLEWSIYQPLANGIVAKVPINDASNPQSIKAYQVCSAPSGPSITYMNPVNLAKDVTFYQPIVVNITDGTGASAGQGSVDTFTVDGQNQAFTANKNGNVTRITQTLTTPWAPNTLHTNILVYHDSLGASYSNYWVFTSLNLSPFGIVQLPLTNMVPYSSLDLSKPGFRVKPYQVTTNSLGNNVPAWEGVVEGLSGPNIADLSLTNGPGFFTWNGPIEFANAVTGDANAPSGEWEWDINFSTFGIQPNSTGSTGNAANLQNYAALEIGTYLYFPQAGTFIMEVDNDDDFRLTSPYGNPFNKYGVYLASVEGGHGAANAGFGSRSATTYVTLSVPAPGAYPFRLLFGNLTGGSGLEWNIWQYLPDGSVAQVLVGDTNTPGAIQAFQASSQDTPYVTYFSPVPGNVYNPNQPAINLTGNTAASTLTNNGPVQGTDIVFALANGATSVNTSTLALSLNGQTQPLIVSNDANGLTWVVRPANSPTWWASGQVGTLQLSFQDNAGRSITMPLTTVATPFWGTLTNALPASMADTTKPGFRLRTAALDGAGTATMATRVHVAEQALAGIWGANVANPKGTNNGYYTVVGTGSTTGLINFNPSGGTAGDFTTTGGFADQLLPGIASFASTTSQRTNSFACEFLTYVNFPAAGVYTLGVNSDDGFRLTSGFNPPANLGAVLVNSPAAVAGLKPTVQNSYLDSYSLTNPVTGKLVLVQGPYAGGTPGNYYGSTNYNGLGYSVDGCIIANSAQLAGNIALIYRSTSCGFVQQVQNAAAAGAIGVVFVQNRPSSEGWFPTSATVAPMQSIPAVMIDLTTGLNLIAAMATSEVNVTLTPSDYLINPPAALSPLGQADVGKGSSDVLFPVVVQQAGLYPLRLVYFQGGGGASVEFFSVNNGTRILINDGSNANALKSYAALAAPTVNISSDGVNLIISYSGTLKTASDPTTPAANWTTVPGTSPLTNPISSSASQQYFRSVYGN